MRDIPIVSETDELQQKINELEARMLLVRKIAYLDVLEALQKGPQRTPKEVILEMVNKL